MILQDLSDKIGIRENDLLKAFSLIKRLNPTPSELSRKVNLSNSQIKRLQKFAIKYITLAGGRLFLTPAGVPFLMDRPNQETHNIVIDEGELLNFVRGIRVNMPKPDRGLDQFYADPETVVKRVLKLFKDGDLEGKRIIVLGDDDLVSVTLAYLNKAKEIIVVEVGENIISVLESVKAKYSLNLRIYPWDLKKALPREFYLKFDTALTDPPYTETGFELFLRRGLECLKVSNLSSFYICYGTSDLSKERSLKIQEIINSYSLHIREKIPNFNKYEAGAESIGNKSDLYILEKTFKTRLAREKNYQRIYSWE